MGTTGRYRDREVVHAGVVGETLSIESADPRNHHQAITDPDGCPRIRIDAKLFVPDGDQRLPAVIVVPGSLGVGPNHERHAATLVDAGFAVCVVDPFGPRAVSSTVADQTQYSFAASAWDVLAVLVALRGRPEVDPDRIGAQGHSRGGSAVLTAASRRFADPVVGAGVALSAVYAVYPWCGQQFRDPRVGPTRVRAIIGDRDEWCSVQQAQGQVDAMRAAGADAEIRVVPGAHHSFDRLEPVHTVDEASVAPFAPTTMLDDDGAMILPGSTSAVGDPALTDRDAFVAAIDAGHGRRGAAIGGAGDQPELFRADMLAFHGRMR